MNSVVADCRSVYEAFTRVAERSAERAFLRAPSISTAAYAPGAIEYSYAAAADCVTELRNGYAARGLGPGERVALAFDARLDVYLHLLALNALGASIVPLNMAGTDVEIGYVIDHSDARLIVGRDEHRPRLRDLVTGDARPEVIGVTQLDGAAGAAPARVSSTTEVALLYTSGTTGRPKGCMLSNEYFLTMGGWYAGLDGLCRLESTDRLLTPLPPNHMNALATSFMGMLAVGGCVIQLDRFHPSSWWRTVRDERASIIHYLGVMPAILLTLNATEEDSFAGQVRFGFGAGSDPRHQAMFEQRFGFPLIEAWAMTESGAGGLTIADREPRHVGERCIGRPVASMEYRLVDEHDRDVAGGEPGELLVRTKGEDPRRGFFSGYYKDDAATEAGWRGGWWHTGDVVREGPDGSLFFVDRRKNVIRRSGENIAAVEVEAALLSSALVTNCAVTAVPDEIRGDEVFALVVASPDAEPSEANARRLIAHCLERLTYFKAPGYVAFVDALPLTASQKVSRGEVKRLAKLHLDAGRSIDLRAAKQRPRR